MSEPVVENARAPAVEPMSSPPVMALRREAILPRERRGGLGAVALLCSLAGVASGFALATTILATQIAQSEARMQRSVYPQGLVRERPWLGVEYVDGDGSARVVRVFENTPAAEIGLKADDRIVRFDAEPIDRYGELGRVVRASSVGHEAVIEVRRGSTMLTFRPTLSGRLLPVNY